MSVVVVATVSPKPEHADEVRQAVRSQGVGGLDQVAAVCLESDGSVSVITDSSVGDGSALADVRGWRAD